jgi:hypothetical protein
MPTFDNLPQVTDLEAGDRLPVDDVSNGDTRYVRLGDLQKSVLGTASVSLSDDAASAVVISAQFAYVVLATDADEGGAIIYRGNGTTTSVNSTANLAVANNTALTGTSGTNGNLTVSYNANDNSLYIENRLGTAINVNLSVLAA